MAEIPTLDSNKIEYLKLQFESLWKDILFRREREFKTLDRIGLFLVAIIGFLLTNKGNELIKDCNIQWVLSIGIVLIVILSIYFLLENGKRLSKTASVIVIISDEIMGFYKKGIYIDSKRVFPIEWKLFGKYKKIFYSQIAVIILITILCLFLIFYLGNS